MSCLMLLYSSDNVLFLSFPFSFHLLELSMQFAKDILDEEFEEVDVFGDLPIYYPALMGCRNVETYEWLNRIEEGTYGVVNRGKDKRTGESAVTYRVL